MIIPGDAKKLIALAKEQAEICNASRGNRGAAYRQYSQYIETGRSQGGLSLSNVLYAHVDRTASFLFCPTDARFSIGFQAQHQKQILAQADHVARKITIDFGIKNFDLTFAQAVFQSLSYGATIIKLGGKVERFEKGGESLTHLKDTSARIVPPWLFGVENEGKNDLNSQESMCETVYLSKFDVQRRIAHLPNKDDLWKRIQSHSSKSGGGQLPNSFIQVLSTSQLNIQPQGANPPTPGGIVQIAGDPSFATVGPQVLAEQFEMQEVWVWDDVREDYLMIQYIEPDVLIAPLHKRINEFCPDHHCYILVQPNEVPGYFWGRSEIVDLTSLQAALSETMDDFRRLIGVQYDKRVAFTGFDQDPAELYDDFRSAGYVNGRQGAEVKDLTPQLPVGALEYIKLLRSTMDDVSGFGNILSGQGEAGVRAGNHANTLLKTSSPRLRDRSLTVERQYAQMGDLYLAYIQEKDATQYHYDPEDQEKSAFLLHQLPSDRRVMVDSHSSSPIYESDNAQMVAFGLKGGLVDGGDAIDMLNFPNKDELKRKWQERAKAQAAEHEFLVKNFPQLALKGAGKK